MRFLIGVMALTTPNGTMVFPQHPQLQEAEREPVIPKAETAAGEEKMLRE